MKKYLLRFLLALAVFSFFVFAYGFFSATNEVLNPQSNKKLSEVKTTEQEGRQDDDGTLSIVALGDSLTRGVGDQTGGGYVKRVKERLEEEWNQEVAITNLAVSGEKMEGLKAQLGQESVKYTVKQADVVLLTISGNDLFPGWGQLDKVSEEGYEVDTKTMLRKALQIMNLIRAQNADAPIYWLGLYNPFEEMKGLESSEDIVVSWNASLERMIVKQNNAYLIPVFDLFQGRTKKLLFSDQFHPNDAGYALMTERLLQTMVSNLELEAAGGE